MSNEKWGSALKGPQNYKKIESKNYKKVNTNDHVRKATLCLQRIEHKFFMNYRIKR